MDPIEPPGRSKCSARTRKRNPGDLRPTDLVGAFFIAGAFFLVSAAVCAIWQSIDPWMWGRWLALHLVFVGGISQLVLGASQFFAGAFLATDPPSRNLVRGQLILWNLGTVTLAVAIPTGTSALLWTAVALLIGGLAFWILAVSTMQRRSLSRIPWATRWYFTAVAFFAAGMIAGTLMADGVIWTHGFLLGAHMSLNLAGFFGTAIVGTLHTFYPSLTQTQLRFPQLQRLSFGAWALGVTALAIGYAWALDGLAIVGWIFLLAGATVMLVSLIDCRRRAAGELSLAARVILAGQPFLLAGLILIAVTAIVDGPAFALSGSDRIVAGTLLVLGWIGLTVAGSLLHLLAVVVRVRNLGEKMPRARPRADFISAAIAVAGVACLAAGQLLGEDGLSAAGRAVVLAVYAYLGARIALLLGRVLRKARPKI